LASVIAISISLPVHRVEPHGNSPRAFEQELAPERKKRKETEKDRTTSTADLGAELLVSEKWRSKEEN
jgi:hypothetical protein